MNQKIRLALSCALLASTLVFGTTAHAQETAKAPDRPEQSGDSMNPFWEKFKAAVINGDKETVAELSRFPISMGYGMSSLKNKAQLVRRFRHVFFNETDAKKCFPKAKPHVDTERPKEFIITCSFASSDEGGEPFEYRFTLTRNGWKFTSFENINE
jgi:hypothetical protein